MTDNDEEVLRRSLDAVDRHRNRLLIGLVFAVGLLLAAFVYGGSTVHRGSMLMFMHAVMIVLGIWMTCLTLVVIIQMTVMTKRILRAIELASKR